MEQAFRCIPFTDEALLARYAYARWEQDKAESLAEYTYRRRTVDLAALLHKAIDDELTDQQQALIRMRYYENRTPVEIAAQTELSPSAVIHILQTAEQKLRHALRYVVAYQNGSHDETLLPLALRNAMAVSAARHAHTGTFGERLRALRTGEHLALPALSLGVQIPQPRVEAMESGEAEPNAGELVRLAGFFGVSVDALLRGDAA